MSSAWIYQDDKQVKVRGAEAASWYVGWIDPEGKRRCKSCGPGLDGKRTAEKLRRKVEAQLMTGTYHQQIKTTWESFRKDYETKILAGLSAETRKGTKSALDAFERHVKPTRVFCIGTATIDEFISKRRADPGVKKGELLSPYTVNHDLRCIRAALTVAKEWEMLPTLPKFRMEKGVKKLPLYVTGDHFAAIYQACDQTRMPSGLPYPSGAWWRALLVFAYMTGWRISEILALRRDDLDLDAGTAITLGEDNKGGRDDRVKLHPVIVEHLRQLPAFDPYVFPWPHHRRTIDKELTRLQRAAGIHLPCRGEHTHSQACHHYGFHDLRRAFATMNADRLSADALQTLMRHKSYQTTQIYINMARQIDAAVNSLHVPEVLRVKRDELRDSRPDARPLEGQAGAAAG